MAQSAFPAASSVAPPQAAYALYNASILDIWGVFKLERACFGITDAYGLDTLFTLLLTSHNTLIKAVSNR